MTRDQIIKLAFQYTVGGLEFDDEGLYRFVAAVAAHEREACAKVCEDDVRTWSYAGSITREECATAIRARKEKT